MGGIPAVCNDPLFGIDPSTGRVFTDAEMAVCDGPTTSGTRDTAAATPTPEDRSASAARDADRLRHMTGPSGSLAADTVPATDMHPAGAPRDIAFGRVSVDAWEVSGSEYAGRHTGDMVFHGEHLTPYRVLQYQGRTFLINDAESHTAMILRAADRGRPLQVTDRLP